MCCQTKTSMQCMLAGMTVYYHIKLLMSDIYQDTSTWLVTELVTRMRVSHMRRMMAAHDLLSQIENMLMAFTTIYLLSRWRHQLYIAAYENASQRSLYFWKSLMHYSELPDPPLKPNGNRQHIVQTVISLRTASSGGLGVQPL